jgi:hypothetical protein
MKSCNTEMHREPQRFTEEGFVTVGSFTFQSIITTRKTMYKYTNNPMTKFKMTITQTLPEHLHVSLCISVNGVSPQRS